MFGVRPGMFGFTTARAPERVWRHWDTMPFTTLIQARTPRSKCPEHGVRTMAVPGTPRPGRFPLLVERFAVAVLLASGRVEPGVRVVGDRREPSAQEIMLRAGERGLERRRLEGLTHPGLDGKSFRREPSSIMRLTDLEASRVLDVVEEKAPEAADQLWATLLRQKEAVEAVAVNIGGTVYPHDPEAGSRRGYRA